MADKKNFKVLIVDDEPEARKLLKSLLVEFENVEVVGEATQAEEALYLLVEHTADLILLDINMPGKSGIDFICLLRKRNVDVPVVFVSAFKKYAIQAIRHCVYDFLLKPVSREDLKYVVEKFRMYNQKDLHDKLLEVLQSIKEETKIRINSRNSYILLNPSEIIYCCSEDGYTDIYLNSDKREVANSSLSQIESKVEGLNFFRLGRSILINQKYIRSIDKTSNTCVLKHNSHIWEVQAPLKSIREILTGNFNYA